MQSTATDFTDRRRDRACFDGMLLTALSYGALLMLFFQLAQAMLLRPKRGRIFYGIITYSVPIFLLSTVAIGGKLRFAEMTYIENAQFPGGPHAWAKANGDLWENVMSMASLMVMPWFGNLLMLNRICVLWNYRWWILCLPFFIYLADVAISIPFLISLSRPHDPAWAGHVRAYKTAYASLTVSFNILVTALIITRLVMLRKKVEQVMGKVQSVFYTSHGTTFVESGAFFSVWMLCYTILFARRSGIENVFLQPAPFISAITRIMIIIRMARNNAWSKDIITASASGILDWQVSSSHSHSIPMHSQDNQNPSQDQIKSLPRKFRDDELSM